jgi:hypothetical protein
MKLPKTLYVKVEEGSDDEEWLTANEDKECLAPDIGETEEVGVYELVKTVKLSTTVEEEEL